LRNLGIEEFENCLATESTEVTELKEHDMEKNLALHAQNRFLRP
jgi:hypothetical protein